MRDSTAAPGGALNGIFLLYRQVLVLLRQGTPTVLAMTGSRAHGAHVQDHATSADSSDDSMTSLLDLDGEVLHDYWSAALDWVRRAAAGPGHGRLFALSTGTGARSAASACKLAERYLRGDSRPAQDH